MADNIISLPLADALACVIQILENNEKYTYAKSYISLKNSIMDFDCDSTLAIKSLTQNDIQNYVNFLCDKKLRRSTIDFYVRTLRALCAKHRKDSPTLFADLDFSKVVLTEKVTVRHENFDPNSKNWYAAKLFVRDYTAIIKLIGEYADDTYIPMTTKIVKSGTKILKTTRPLCSLIFFHSKHTDTGTIAELLCDKAMVYTTVTTDGKQASVIPEKEMEIFRIVTSTDNNNIEYISEDITRFHEGQRVRVIAGEFEGAEGTIVRIKKDRRLVVTITGICAVATPHLSPALLMNIG